jgi:hypothetical protein
MSQFRVGQKLDVGGLFFRVDQGHKHPDDLVLDVWVPDVHSSGEWRPVEMRMVGMAHALFCENEDRLYPPPRWLGAQCWREFLRLCETDWEGASKKVAKEKAWADQKRRAS